MCLAIPGKIISITNNEPMTRSGKVSFGGVVTDVNISTVPEAGVGDYVIVHVGFAISKVDEAEAKRTFTYIREMNPMKDLEESTL